MSIIYQKKTICNEKFENYFKKFFSISSDDFIRFSRIEQEQSIQYYVNSYNNIQFYTGSIKLEQVNIDDYIYPDILSYLDVHILLDNGHDLDKAKRIKNAINEYLPKIQDIMNQYIFWLQSDASKIELINLLNKEQYSSKKSRFQMIYATFKKLNKIRFEDIHEEEMFFDSYASGVIRKVILRYQEEFKLKHLKLLKDGREEIHPLVAIFINQFLKKTLKIEPI